MALLQAFPPRLFCVVLISKKDIPSEAIYPSITSCSETCRKMKGGQGKQYRHGKDLYSLVLQEESLDGVAETETWLRKSSCRLFTLFNLNLPFVLVMTGS
jgi:hypothetical protein